MKDTKMSGGKGFTLIELLVVIAIIGVLSAVVLVSLNSARQRSRDARRVSDMRQIMTAMELYYNDNGGYPDQLVNAYANPNASSTGPSGGSTTEWQDFLATWPTAPTPADGSCALGGTTDITVSTNQYTYWGRNAADSASDITDPPFYRITFCIGSSTSGYPAGELVATPRQVLAN